MPAIPVLHLDGFDGPMDLLLDLAERQRIDLGRISVLALVEQFAAAMDCLAARVPVERRADWVVVATRLVLLRSKLLFPASPEAVAAAEREAAREIERLESVRFVRAAAAWLLARPQLGHAVFARPTAGPDPRAASYMALMEACLTVLRGREGEPDAAEAVYRPPIPDLFRVPGALVRMRAKLAAIAGAEPLEVFLPLMPRGHHEPGAGRPLGRGQHLHGRARTRAWRRAGAPSGRGLSLDHRYPCARPGSGAGTRACIAVPPSPGFRAGPWAATPPPADEGEGALHVSLPDAQLMLVELGRTATSSQGLAQAGRREKHDRVANLGLRADLGGVRVGPELDGPSLVGGQRPWLRTEGRRLVGRCPGPPGR